MTENKQGFTFSRILGPVKRGSAARGLFDGAETLFLAVGFVLVSAALAAPRPTAPEIVPLPQPDRRSLSLLAAKEHARAEAARRAPLPYDVRAVGELVRRAGAAKAPRKLATLAAPLGVSGDLAALSARALAQHGPEPLLALRAVQTELFVAATHAWEASGEIPDELRELGGEFTELARASGWLAGRKLVLDDRERAVLFRARFGELTRLGDKPPFAATLDERRESYALLLRHPTGADAGARARIQYRSVQALAKIDPDYPAAFARGVLLYRAGAYEAAAGEFRAQLGARPDGFWALRAKNHLLAALAQRPPEE
jgi:hypothetical protein